MSGSVDQLWVTIAATLVLIMQAGFMLLEGGMCRSKNSISVAQKNLADFSVSAVSFGAIGFVLMFGTSAGGYVGIDFDMSLQSNLTAQTVGFFVFQVMFAGTCATIVSGTVAERFSFTAYLVAIPFISGILYPIYGHWAWGNLLNEDNTAWLADLGFVDYAGSTVVHSAGGWIALAAALAVGPRLGRFKPDGSPEKMHGHNLVLSGVGVMLLFVGWIGFNGGSEGAMNDAAILVIGNTVIAACVGGVTGMLLGHWIDKLYLPQRLFNGILGGLVGITAGCAVVGPTGAMALGCLGAAAATLAEELLLKLKIDDVVGAISVHGVGGLVGTVALPIFALSGALGEGSLLSQIGIQAFGAGLAFVWFFGTSSILFKCIGFFIPLRVSQEDERKGLNEAEHGSQLGFGVLQNKLSDVVANGDLDTNLELEPADDAYEISTLFNKLLERMRAERTQRLYVAEQDRIIAQSERETEQRRNERLEQKRRVEEEMASQIAAIIGQIEKKRLDRRITLSQEVGTLNTVATGVNQMMDTLAHLVASIDFQMREVAQAAENQQKNAHSLSESQTFKDQAIKEAGTRLQEVAGAIEQGRKASEQAREAMQETDVAAKKGLSSVESAVEAAKRMQEASSDALSLVKSIDSISRETNLLAINAGVEAARAGAYGQSFAVVANEVQRLAMRSAELAEQVSGVLNGASQRVSDCVERIEDSSQAFCAVASSAKFAHDSVEDIFATAQKQTELNQALSGAIEVIARFSSQDRMCVDQTAESSAYLTQSAVKLKDEVSAYQQVQQTQTDQKRRSA